jgi:hypothetical protein
VVEEIGHNGDYSRRRKRMKDEFGMMKIKSGKEKRKRKAIGWVIKKDAVRRP